VCFFGVFLFKWVSESLKIAFVAFGRLCFSVCFGGEFLMKRECLGLIR
jgi:hypothetical protein